jgi:Xaa-Pro aminopeptidase
LTTAAETRADRLVDLVRERELDCLLVTNLVNVRYLTGFTGTNGACLVTPEERLFLTDFRYVERAEAEVTGFERATIGRDMLGDLAGRLRGRSGFDDAHVSVRTHRKLGEKVPDGTELVAAGGLVERLRAVKDAEELRIMGEAAKLADGVYQYMCDRGLRGRTEREVALDLEHEMRQRGAEDPSFPSIIAAEANGALPHATPRDVEIPANTLVVVDMGARVDGYCSDCTRTFATGELEDEASEVYELVRRAQEALGAVRAGADCKGVDGVARDVIEAAGYGERFGHGLGHGVGLEVHEEPRLAKSAEGELVAGNAVTVEPGVYLPGRFGVRIEDLVAVTDDGCDILTTGIPKTLVTVE